MANEEQKKKNSEQNEYEEEKRAFRSAMLTFWLTTQIERDKHLLSLSAGAIGLLVTLMMTVGVKSVFQASIYGISILLFLVCIGAVVFILGRNATYIEGLLLKNKPSDRVLTFLDRTASTSFILGVVCVLLIGGTAMVENLTKLKETNMAKEKSNKVSGRILHKKADYQDSVAGADVFQPKKPQKQPDQTKGSGSKSDGGTDKDSK